MRYVALQRCDVLDIPTVVHETEYRTVFGYQVLYFQHQSRLSGEVYKSTSKELQKRYCSTDQFAKQKSSVRGGGGKDIGAM